MATIATHNGSAAHRAHNLRDPRVAEKEEHINPSGEKEVWKDIPPREAYKRIFGKDIKDYNSRQARPERRIEDYYSVIEKDKKKHAVYEMIAGVYPAKDEAIDHATQKAILKDFVDTWKERNPNLYICGAYYHADEQGEPHVHIDYIPIAHGYTKGLAKQNGLVRALGEMGFEKDGRSTAQILWEKRENRALEDICRNYGIEVSHPSEKREHLRTDAFKATQELSACIDNTKELIEAQDALRSEIRALEQQRDLAEKQADKALKRKERVFAKSFHKDKSSGVILYNQNLEREIRDIVKERSADVKAISHSDIEVQREYELARSVRIQAERDAKQLHEQAEQELANLKAERDYEQAYILREAKRLFQDFIREAFKGKSVDRTERLEELCSEIQLNNGKSVLDYFEKQEAELQRQLEEQYQSYSRGFSR